MRQKKHITRKEAELSYHELADPLQEDWIFTDSLTRNQENSQRSTRRVVDEWRRFVR